MISNVGPQSFSAIERASFAAVESPFVVAGDESKVSSEQSDAERVARIADINSQYSALIDRAAQAEYITRDAVTETVFASRMLEAAAALAPLSSDWFALLGDFAPGGASDPIDLPLLKSQSPPIASSLAPLESGGGGGSGHGGGGASGGRGATAALLTASAGMDSTSVTLPPATASAPAAESPADNAAAEGEQSELSGSGGISGLAGDYNDDYVVDAVDYTVWRNAVGADGSHPANGNGDSIVDQLDYDVWKEHYGEKLLPGAFSIDVPSQLELDGEFVISWESSPGATSYELVVSQQPDLTSPLIVETLATTSRAFDGVGGSTLFFGVTAKNNAGEIAASNTGAMSTIVFRQTSQVVFVTSNQYFIDFEEVIPPFFGLFGSAAAADYHMTHVASQIGLLPEPWDQTTIHFKALINVAFGDLGTRANVGGHFFNVAGDRIATTMEQLFGGEHSAPVLDQNGAVVMGGNVPVWTGSNPDGTSAFTADNWSSPTASAGTVGNAAASDNTWLSNGTRAAHLGARLYGIGVTPLSLFDSSGPIVANPIVNQDVSVGVPVALNVATAFYDADDDEVLRYYARQTSGLPLPAWLTLNQSTGSLSGTPTANDVGTLTIEIAAFETYGGQVTSEQFDLTIAT